jgi:hypothetical protein
VIASSYSPLLLILLLACPLMMLFMMRGHGHGQGHSSHAGGCHGGHHGDDDTSKQPSLDELRGRRADIDAQIRALEDEEADRLTPSR